MLQVGDHQFVELQVIRMWIVSMLVSWTSATNCARLYNLCYKSESVFLEWPFSFMAMTELVWDSFVLLSILEDCKRRLATLILPHTGLQRDRFTVAIQERNIRFRLYGQPNIRHYCKKCVRFFNDGRKVAAVVIDGVTIGRPCCSIHNCHDPLQSNQDRFCPDHARFNLVCAVVGCDVPTAPKSRTCLDPDHQATEKTHHERGQARFQLKERMKRARVAHPNDALAQEENHTDGESDSDREKNNSTQDNSLKSKPRIKARFSRRHTHNEQIIVAPCGVILSRATFFGAEGVGSVIVHPFSVSKCYLLLYAI